MVFGCKPKQCFPHAKKMRTPMALMSICLACVGSRCCADSAYEADSGKQSKRWQAVQSDAGHTLIAARDPSKALLQLLMASRPSALFHSLISKARSAHFSTTASTQAVLLEQRKHKSQISMMSNGSDTRADSWLEEIRQEANDLFLFVKEPTPNPVAANEGIVGMLSLPESSAVWWRRIFFWTFASIVVTLLVLLAQGVSAVFLQSLVEDGDRASMPSLVKDVESANMYSSKGLDERIFQDGEYYRFVTPVVEELFFRAPLTTYFFTPEEFPVAVRCSVLLFALVHITQYDISRLSAIIPIWFFPFLFWGQFLDGILFSWLRVRGGLPASLISHLLIVAFALVVNR